MRTLGLGKGSPQIVLVATDGLQPAAFHLGQHSALCWMAIHGTHGPDDFRSGHGHLQLRQPWEILSEIGSAGTGPGYHVRWFGSAEWASVRPPQCPQSCIDTYVVHANRMT